VLSHILHRYLPHSSMMVEGISSSVEFICTLHCHELACANFCLLPSNIKKGQLWVGLIRASSGVDWFAGTTSMVDVTYCSFPQQCYANLHLPQTSNPAISPQLTLSHHKTSTNTGSQPPGKISVPEKLTREPSPVTSTQKINSPTDPNTRSKSACCLRSGPSSC